MDALRRAAIRVVRAWRAQGGEQRVAAIAAIVLFLTMFLPWYQLETVVPKSGRVGTHNVNAFAVFSFVEGAVLLVAFGVLLLLFLRGERRAFHLPGGDGTVVFAGGVWTAILLFVRVIDRPPGGGYPVGIAWGFFVAFLAAGFLAYAGLRMRAVRRPEPPLPGDPTPTNPRHPPTPMPPSPRRPRQVVPDEPPTAHQLSFDEAETQQVRRD